MSSKQFNLEGVGPVKIYKRRNSRSVRITISGDGEVKITIPTYVPYSVGVAFARSKSEWLKTHKDAKNQLINHGQSIGKNHHIYFAAAEVNKITTAVNPTEVIIKHPKNLETNHPSVQLAATTAGVKALRSQAELLLPMRLENLAKRYGFEYKSVKIKKLKGRWGSCDHNKNIVLNLFLMQLSWELIDYVLLHELTHTKILQHGKPFWSEMLQNEPKAKLLRKQIKNFNPVIAG